MEIQDLTIKGYTFNCEVAGFEFPRGLMEQLQVDEDSFVSVMGEFSVQWDDETPMVLMDSCTAISDYGSVECNSYIQDYIRDMLQSYELDVWHTEWTELEADLIYSNGVDK